MVSAAPRVPIYHTPADIAVKGLRISPPAPPDRKPVPPHFNISIWLDNPGQFNSPRRTWSRA